MVLKTTPANPAGLLRAPGGLSPRLRPAVEALEGGGINMRRAPEDWLVKGRAGGEEIDLISETHGSRAVVRGCVPDEQCRTAVLRIAGEELTGLDWYEDLTVSRPRAPDHSEDLP
ncbi:hypothetical protein ACFVX6_38250 [Streptomyces sp. NPDC058289]|uniref:hypothetical protein n=1 Tax=Streptomyces sp. NPDC058289 TaxID=3346425 RepID=UPI0036E9115A